MAAPGSPTDTLPGITRTVSFNYLRALFDYADRQGLTTGHLLAASGIDPDADRDGRLDVAACHAVFEQAARLLGDEDVGLRAGLRMRLGHYGAAAYAALSCRWGMEAIHYLSRYQALVMDVGAPRLLADRDTLLVHWHTNDAWRRHRYMADYNLAGLLTCVRAVMGEDLRILRVDLAYAPPADRRALEALCGCPIRFSQPSYRLVAPLSVLGYPLPEPNPEVCQAMTRLAEQQLRLFSREGEGFLPQLRQRLNWSGVLDDVRRTLAATYIRDPALSLGEVAFLLGFAEQSSFQKSFKRWFGETPGRYRRQLP